MSERNEDTHEVNDTVPKNLLALKKDLSTIEWSLLTLVHKYEPISRKKLVMSSFKS